MTDPVVVWTTTAVVAPFLGALLALHGALWALRAGLVLGATSSVASALALWRAVAEGPRAHHLGGWAPPLGIELRVDGLGVAMLLVTAVVGTVVSIYSTAYFGNLARLRARAAPGARGARYFAPLWLFLWGTINALYLSGDLFNLYVTLEILGLTAATLVTLAVTPAATSAGMRYLVVSLVGSMLFLLGIVLLYVLEGTLTLEPLGAATLDEPLARVALAVMTAGLAAKTALAPLHGWLPPAHAAAPAPASAILSALVVKASFYILVRLWVDVFGGATESGLLALGMLGGWAILWGSLMALRQTSLKRLVAYSTVAQLGYLFVSFPLLLDDSGALSPNAYAGGIYHALSHAVAKAAMFLAAGCMSYAVARDDLSSISGVAQRAPMSFIAFGLGGLSLAGIPPTGGFVAKWMLLQAAMAQQGWGWVALLAAGGLLTAAYVFLALRWAARGGDMAQGFRPIPRRMEWAAVTLALLGLVMGLRSTGLLALLDRTGVAG